MNDMYYLRKYISKAKGFSMAELMVALLLISVALAAVVPIMTKRLHNSGTEQNALQCITANATDISMNYTTGNITSFPTSGYCYASYYGCKIGKTDICNTLYSYADGNFTSTLTTAARKVLRASCDKGGSDACKYFISRCVDNVSGCSNTTYPYFTLRYYMNLFSNNTAQNFGRAYIESQSKNYYCWNITSFTNEINTSCSSYTPNKTSCNVKNSACPDDPPDPTCGAMIIGSIKVSLCNNEYNLGPNGSNPGGTGCWQGLNTTCSGTGCSRNICNLNGAVAACSALNGGVNYGTRNWRLPTLSEMAIWASYLSNLDLCD